VRQPGICRPFGLCDRLTGSASRRGPTKRKSVSPNRGGHLILACPCAVLVRAPSSPCAVRERGLPQRRTTRRGTRAGERRPPHTVHSGPRAQSAGRDNQRPNCQRRSSGFGPRAPAGNIPGIRARRHTSPKRKRVSVFFYLLLPTTTGGTHSLALRAHVFAGTAGGWGRCPQGDAPRSEACALGARWLPPARPQPPRSCHHRRCSI